MQAPATLNMTCYQGASFDYSLIWKVSGTAINLTGYSARMQVREQYDSNVAVLTFTSGSGIVLGGTTGSIVIEASPTTTAGVAAGQYVYDLELVNPTNGVTRLVEGIFSVDPEVTR